MIKKAGKNILEIGFGAGEHVRSLALSNPDSIIIGAEPFMNGVASLLSAITNESDNTVKPEYKSLYIWPDDVRKILQSESPDFIDMRFDKIWILHPDPWPKARHEKRRLLNTEFLNLLATRLTDDGVIIIGTDHHEYYDWIMDQVKNSKLGIRNQESEIIKTRYQKKNMAGTATPKYLVLSK